MGQNFTAANSSIDKAIDADATYGSFYRIIQVSSLGGTIATSDTNYITANRCPQTITIPPVSSTLSGYIATNCHAVLGAPGVVVLALEYLLGTFDMTGTFTPGVSMPIKPIKGTNVQTASGLTLFVADNNLSSAAGVFTITYTDQEGITNKTATLTLPASVNAGTGYTFQATMQTLSKGVRAITNITTAAVGASGTVKIYGLLPIHVAMETTNVTDSSFFKNLAVPYLCEPNEQIGVYQFVTNSQYEIVVMLGLTPEVE